MQIIVADNIFASCCSRKHSLHIVFLDNILANCPCGSYFVINLANFCSVQHFCKVSSRTTFLLIVVLDNNFTNFSFGQFCCCCKSSFRTTLLHLQFVGPDHILANWSSGQHFCKLMLLSIILQIDVLVNNLFANCQWRQHFCKSSLWIIFCKLMFEQNLCNCCFWQMVRVQFGRLTNFLEK